MGTAPDKEALKNIEKTIAYYNENHRETAYDGLRYDAFSSSEYETYRLTELKADESIKVSEPLLLQSSIVFCENLTSKDIVFSKKFWKKQSGDMAIIAPDRRCSFFPIILPDLLDSFKTYIVNYLGHIFMCLAMVANSF